MSREHTYEIVSGFFTDPNDIGPVQIPPRFGLIDSSPARWVQFKIRISQMNATAPKGTSYRALFIGRHGQGFHNVAESLYGSAEWNKTQAKSNGDENITWGPDPKLTDLGIKQALAVNSAWKAEMVHSIPLPESLYSSPFSRAIHTALITFDGIRIDALSAPHGQRRPIIKEKLREVNGVHTCDKRSTRSYIAKTFPEFDIEPGFSEDDGLWREDHRETSEEITARLSEALDEIFREDPATYISITAHGGAIKAILIVLGIQPHELPTGGVISLVVKVTNCA